MILTALDIDPTQFEQRTGWSIKPQGACKGEQCVPLPANARNANGSLNGAVVAEALGMPLIKDEKHQLWALGPESLTGRALTTAQAPHLVLPDLEGKLFELASLRGKKVLLTTWASWCGCRTDGPIWAEVRERLYPKGLEIVTVAMDTAGADAVREWIELANPRHPALIDQAHIMGELFGVVNVPNGIWINEAGVIVRPAEPSWPGRTPVTEMELDDIEKWESVKQLTPAHVQILREVKKMRFETELYLQMLEDWAEHGANSQYVLSEQEVIDRSQPRPPAVAQAAARYELGQHLHLAGHHDDAIPHWREAHRLQPDNWTYKRQAWSFEDPTVQDPKGVYDGSMLGDLLEVGAINYYPKIIP
ncbi:redoxin domain-containing protein [Pseudomaricurvus alcaniphilus]|uniref:ResA-like WAxxUGC motif-containing protein n=1 Tax=Pseudomaricurvus alcaniphilus TaxID=1166482 RepID=UPI001407E532|nr:ResA-like WAxxUGC motif-containing protein [Pseudomaricurvus alcaniphilus]NHN38248.1 redoxin domain-containing protein [Pseudomaricurvus alcaniphilus]